MCQRFTLKAVAPPALTASPTHGLLRNASINRRVAAILAGMPKSIRLPGRMVPIRRMNLGGIPRTCHAKCTSCARFRAKATRTRETSFPMPEVARSKRNASTPQKMSPFSTLATRVHCSQCLETSRLSRAPDVPRKRHVRVTSAPAAIPYSTTSQRLHEACRAKRPQCTAGQTPQRPLPQ